MAEILRKMTLKSLGLTETQLKAVVDASGGHGVAVANIVGKITGSTPGQTALGEYVKLQGNFYGINLDTGEAFESATCLLPNFISDTLVGALDQSDEVEFGIQVGVKAAKSATGYEYTCRPLVESKPSDAMQKLIAIAMTTTPKALAA
jgi:hypothetical protein